MTATEAVEWVRAEMEADPDDQQGVDVDELRAAWEALYGRPLTDEDDQSVSTLWAECVAAAG